MPKKKKAPNFDLSLTKMHIPDEITDFKDQFHYFLQEHAEENRKLYEQTENPLYAWTIIHIWFSHCPAIGTSVLQAGHPLPQWICDYLKESAGKLLFPEEDYGAKKAGEFLGFKSPGGPGASRRYHDKMQKHYLLEALCSLLEREPKLTVIEACEILVNRQPEAMISSGTLKTWYNNSNRDGKI